MGIGVLGLNPSANWAEPGSFPCDFLPVSRDMQVWLSSDSKWAVGVYVSVNGRNY